MDSVDKPIVIGILVVGLCFLFMLVTTLSHENGVNSTYAKLYKIEHPELLERN